MGFSKSKVQKSSSQNENDYLKSSVQKQSAILLKILITNNIITRVYARAGYYTTSLKFKRILKKLEF